MFKKNDIKFIFDEYIYNEEGKQIPIPNERALKDINMICNHLINEMRMITGSRPDKFISRMMKIVDLTRTLLFVLNGHRTIEGLPDLVEFETGMSGVVFSNSDRYCGEYDYDLLTDVEIGDNEPDRSLN
jgi:hypothetical protein